MPLRMHCLPVVTAEKRAISTSQTSTLISVTPNRSAGKQAAETCGVRYRKPPEKDHGEQNIPAEWGQRRLIQTLTLSVMHD